MGEAVGGGLGRLGFPTPPKKQMLFQRVSASLSDLSVPLLIPVLLVLLVPLVLLREP